MGGEKIWLDSTPCVFPGSPPRGRGKADVLFSQFFTRRITPAWAGKSFFADFFIDLIEDHPRVGGEKAFFFRFHYTP